MATIGSSVLAYSSADVNNANYLAGRNIIRDWSTAPANYNLEAHITRVDVMGMALAMAGITKNTTCRRDFSDVDMTGVHADWACRTIETAADHGFINAQTNVSSGYRTTRPYDNISRSETLAIFLKAFPNNSFTGDYSYFWNQNFPVVGDSVGYSNAYYFGAQWQAAVLYDYIRHILHNDSEMNTAPRASEDAKLKEVFDFAAHILQQ